MGLRFTRQQRVRRKQDFDRLFKAGSRARGTLLNLWLYRHSLVAGRLQKPKLAIMISRKTAPSSVVRNRWKRKIREAFRCHPDRIGSGCEILVQVKSGQKVPVFKDVEKELLTLIENARQRS
ncbi:MAG: ribonuclease P protein component [Candidatus Omnitrophota bacterium]